MNELYDSVINKKNVIVHYKKKIENGFPIVRRRVVFDVKCSLQRTRSSVKWCVSVTPWYAKHETDHAEMLDVNGASSTKLNNNYFPLDMTRRFVYVFALSLYLSISPFSYIHFGYIILLCVKTCISQCNSRPSVLMTMQIPPKLRTMGANQSENGEIVVDYHCVHLGIVIHRLQEQMRKVDDPE